MADQIFQDTATDAWADTTTDVWTDSTSSLFTTEPVSLAVSFSQPRLAVSIAYLKTIVVVA